MKTLLVLGLSICIAVSPMTGIASEQPSTKETIQKLIRCSKYYRAFIEFTVQKMRERLKEKKNKNINPKVADYSRFVMITHEPAFLKACKEMPDYELKNAEDRLKQAKEGKINL